MGETVSDIEGQAGRASRQKRADARRNEQTLLDAAADVFVTSGVEAPVRDIAARAGVGMGTIYRHFPTRADLIIAVYRHQVDACAEAGPALLASSSGSAQSIAIDVIRLAMSRPYRREGGNPVRPAGTASGEAGTGAHGVGPA